MVSPELMLLLALVIPRLTPRLVLRSAQRGGGRPQALSLSKGRASAAEAGWKHPVSSRFRLPAHRSLVASIDSVPGGSIQISL